jgi:tripartite-type tricarboxylate transporter receptor subunit TctC
LNVARARRPEDPLLMRALAWAAAVALVAAAPSAALAQAYPTKPVRVIVPFAPGGGSDAVGRVLAQKLGERLGQQFVVENRTGAGGSIGAAAVAKAAADGYTLLLGSISEVALFPAVNPGAPYDPLKDFAPIGLTGVVPFVLVASDTVPARTVQELVQLAKAEPGKLAYGSAGNGSTTHLAVELFASIAGVKFTHVPYKGSAPVMTDLLNGTLQFALSTMPAALPHAKNPKVRMLAVTTATRATAMPEVPTMQEAGVKGYATALWTGLLAPAGTPPSVVEVLARETAAAVADAEVRAALMRQGAEPSSSTPAQFAAQIRSDLETWRAVVKEAGIKGE